MIYWELFSKYVLDKEETGYGENSEDLSKNGK